MRSARFLRLWYATLLAMMGCTHSRQPEATIFISGDTHGWITPCGCAANQSGGLARRATLLSKDKSQSEIIALDVGGSAIGTTEYQRTRFEYLLRGMVKMELVAHNIGSSETEFSPEELRKLGKDVGIQWLSSNLEPKDEKPFGVPYILRTVAGMKIQFVGLTDPAKVIHADWIPKDPVRSALTAMKQTKADVRIVLAYFDEKGLRSLANALPEADYIIGGPTGQSLSPSRVGNATVLSATNKGKFLAKLVLARESKRFKECEASIVDVKSSYSEDKLQLANLNRYREVLKERDYSSRDSGLVSQTSAPARGYEIAGSSSCARCHLTDDAVWHQTKHSHAWEVLVKRNTEFDPQCQQCHTTGYGLSGGFDQVATTAAQVGVGCENCHGPSSAHVNNPKKRTPYQAKEQCVVCHDHENSPTFQWDTYWPRIVHGPTQATNVSSFLEKSESVQ